MIIADGFSCQEQIQQLTDRRALHLAEVIQLALNDGARGPAGNYPEREHAREEAGGRPVAVAITSALVAFALGSLAERLIRNPDRDPRRFFKR